MRKSVLLILIFICSFIFFGCDEDSKNNLDFEYPTKVGTKWVYQRILKATNFDTDSLEQIYAHIDTSVAISEILKNEILRDSIETLVFNTDGYFQYNQVKDDGFYTVAYKNAGYGPPILPKNLHSSGIKLKGISFSNITELALVLQQQIPLAKIESDSIIFEEEPVQVLKYPLHKGLMWTYRELNSPFKIEKKVVEQVTINLDAGSFECYHIKWLYDLNNDGSIDEDIYMDDYISKEGLIKREFSAFNLINTNAQGEEIGHSDFFDTFTLVELYL